jgi:1,2-diacylglycerol 3-alpha-glucosyltransferase
MRIIEATDFYFPWIAGPSQVVADLTNGLLNRGHEVVIAAPSPTGRPYSETAVPHVHRVGTVPVPFGYNVRAGAPFVALPRLVRTFKPDIIHIHHPFPISVAALMVGRVAGIPVVATNHTIPECVLYGLRSNRLGPIVNAALWAEIRLVLRTSRAVVTPTHTAADLLARAGFKGDVAVISNGIDTDRFSPCVETRGSETPIVLYTGRLDAEKELDVLIEAIPRVLTRCDAHFRIGGEGVQLPGLKARVRLLGLEGRVSFSGYVPADELPAVYKSADVFVMTSPVELQSITTLEAVASGLPIVAVKAGALPELVDPNKNGRLVAPGDSVALAEALIELLRDQPLRRKMGEASRQSAMKHALPDTVSKYEDLFQRMIGERNSGDLGRRRRLQPVG